MQGLYLVGETPAAAVIDVDNLPADLVAWQRENPGLITIELAGDLNLHVADQDQARRG
jgi:hypothetical protein